MPLGKLEVYKCTEEPDLSRPQGILFSRKRRIHLLQMQELVKLSDICICLAACPDAVKTSVSRHSIRIGHIIVGMTCPVSKGHTAIFEGICKTLGQTALELSCTVLAIIMQEHIEAVYIIINRSSLIPDYLVADLALLFDTVQPVIARGQRQNRDHQQKYKLIDFHNSHSIKRLDSVQGSLSSAEDNNH